jgi:hypothetical protein
MKTLLQFVLFYAVAYAAPMVSVDSHPVVNSHGVISQQNSSEYFSWRACIGNEDVLLTVWCNSTALRAGQNLRFEARCAAGPASSWLDKTGLNGQRGVHIVVEGTADRRSERSQSHPLPWFENNHFRRISDLSPFLIAPSHARVVVRNGVIDANGDHDSNRQSSYDASKQSEFFHKQTFLVLTGLIQHPNDEEDYSQNADFTKRVRLLFAGGTRLIVIIGVVLSESQTAAELGHLSRTFPCQKRFGGGRDFTRSMNG